MTTTMPMLREERWELATLPGGPTLLLAPMPGALTLHASLFVQAGSAHEAARWPGLAHAAEHLVFKGTRRFDAEQLNLHAESRGADVNAHTDKDHAAFHLRGLAPDLPAFVDLLAELVLEPTFPADELERERQVLLQEFAEVADDPVSTAYALMDRSCWGRHPLAHPVIGMARTLEHMRREDLVQHVATLYSPARMVLAVAGDVEIGALARLAEAAFGRAAPRPGAAPLAAPQPGGGVRTRGQSGSSQTHMVLGFGVPGMQQPDAAFALASVVLGEGMSSPLVQQLREREGLAYQVGASCDLLDGGGQFIVDASTAPAHAGKALGIALDLLRRLADEGPDAAAVERAQRQWLVRQALAQERVAQRLEGAAVETLLLGRPRRAEERAAPVLALGRAELREGFARLVGRPAALGLAGHVPRGLRQQAEDALQARGLVTGET